MIYSPIPLDPDAPVLRAIRESVRATKKAFEQEGLRPPKVMVLGEQSKDRLKALGIMSTLEDGWGSVQGVKLV